MSSLTQVFIYSLLGGIVSLIGGILLLANRKRAKNLAEYATPFAAGALLAAAFVDLLQEANHEGDIDQALTFTLVGILVFFLLERFLHWFHHHHEHVGSNSDPKIPLIIAGDTLHNAIDGIAIAAGFLVSPSTGMVVTLAVAAHEIPQEIGDFGLLLQKGLSRRKVLAANIFSALATTVTALLFFQLGQDTNIRLDIVLGLVAGFFIYVAVSDIIPMIHKKEAKVFAGPQTALLIMGVIVVSLVTNTLHQYIESEGSHNHGSEVTVKHTDDAHEHDMYEYTDHETVPTVEVFATEDSKQGWNIHIETTNFTFAPKEVGKENKPGYGHAHVFVNGEKWGRVYGSDVYMSDLKAGDELKVVLSTNDHKTYMHDGEEVMSYLIVGEDHEKHHTTESTHHNH